MLFSFLVLLPYSYLLFFLDFFLNRSRYDTVSPLHTNEFHSVLKYDLFQLTQLAMYYCTVIVL